jgi:hypothetical protein
MRIARKPSHQRGPRPLGERDARSGSSTARRLAVHRWMSSGSPSTDPLAFSISSMTAPTTIPKVPPSVLWVAHFNRYAGHSVYSLPVNGTVTFDSRDGSYLVSLPAFLISSPEVETIILNSSALFKSINVAEPYSASTRGLSISNARRR